MSVDVTEQVLNKLKLIESEASVRRLFEQTPVGIGIFKGESLIIENVNAALLSYGGRKYEDVINKPLFSVIPEIEGQGFKEIAQTRLYHWSSLHLTGSAYKVIPQW